MVAQPPPPGPLAFANGRAPVANGLAPVANGLLIVAPQLQRKQQVDYALATSSRTHAVAAVEAAHARSRPASSQTRVVGTASERDQRHRAEPCLAASSARPYHSRCVASESLRTFGHRACSSSQKYQAEPPPQTREGNALLQVACLCLGGCAPGQRAAFPPKSSVSCLDGQSAWENALRARDKRPYMYLHTPPVARLFLPATHKQKEPCCRAGAQISGDRGG